jgi:hypothetical protein
MPRRSEDPRVADLNRYRKAREMQRRQAPQRAPTQRFLGDRPRAGLILFVVIVVLAAVTLLPALR